MHVVSYNYSYRVICCPKVARQLVMSSSLRISCASKHAVYYHIQLRISKIAR